MMPQMILARIHIGQTNSGGFITIKCESEDEIRSLKSMAVAKVRAKRIQRRRTGDISVKDSDYCLSLRPRFGFIDESPGQTVNTVFANQLRESAVITLFLVPSVQKQRETNAERKLEINGLCTYHNTYLHSDGQGSVACIASSTVEGTGWVLSIGGDNSLTLLDCSGHYLTADPSGKVYTTAQKGEWTKWTLVENEFFRSTAHKSYLTANADGSLVCAGKGAYGRFTTQAKTFKGFLKKKSSSTRMGSKWQTRFFILSKGQLMYYSNAVTSPDAQVPRKSFVLAEMEQIQLGEYSNDRDVYDVFAGSIRHQ